jgi:hypothetical protein
MSFWTVRVSKNQFTPTQLLQLDEVVPAAPSSGGQKEK